MTIIDKIVFSQNAPAKNTLWARPSEKGTELLIFNKGKWGTVGADDFQRFHYEVYPSLEDITEPKPNALYLIGPKGEGEDKYDEYVYTEEGFTKIGDTSIDMSDVIKYNKNSDDSYTLKAEGTEIKKLKTTDDSTIVLGNNNSIEFGASGTINMQSGKIDNVGTISGSSGGMNITASGTGVTINDVKIISGSISGVSKLTFHTGGFIENVGNIPMAYHGNINMNSGTLQSVDSIGFVGGGNTLKLDIGAEVPGASAIWTKNFGVSGDLVFSGNSSVQKRVGTSGSIPVITFGEEKVTGVEEYKRTMTLGKDNALSVIDYYSGSNPLQPHGTPEVNVSGTLNVFGRIYAGSTCNNISGNSGGMYINASGRGGIYINDGNVTIDPNGKINAHNIIIGSGTLDVSGGTLNVSGGTIMMDNANIAGNIKASGATINGAYLSGVYIRGGYLYDNTQMGSVDISGSINAPYQTLTINRITGVSGGINMDRGSISGASSIYGAGGAVNIGFSGAGISGKLDMISGILETSGVTLKSSGVLTFGDGTTMSTAATPTNLDDANNVIGGKKLKLYYSGMTGTICTTGAMGVLKIKGASGILLDPDGGYIDCNNRNISGCNAIDVIYINAQSIKGDLYGTLFGSVSGAGTIDMSSNGFITGVGTINMSSNGLITGVKIIDMQVNPSTTINMHSGTINMGAGTISGAKDITFGFTGTISGNNTTITNMIYESGNTFTTGFVDELKTALGIS